MLHTSIDHLAYEIQGLHNGVAEDMRFQIFDAGQVNPNVSKEHGVFIFGVMQFKGTRTWNV
jgi:hypothetical protein